VSDAWLKAILMIPARFHIAKSAAIRSVRHVARRRLGDSSRRVQCCGPRPATYPVNHKVASIPELVPLLERTSSINGGYSPFFCCKICGQEWYEDFEPLKFGANICVRKAT
jgi:hypothetical protein